MAIATEELASPVQIPPTVKKWAWRGVIAIAIILTISTIVSLVRTNQKAEEKAQAVAATATRCSDASALETLRCTVVRKSNKFKNALDGPLPGDQMKICSRGAELKSVLEGGTRHFWFEVEGKEGVEAAYRLIPVTEKCPLTL